MLFVTGADDGDTQAVVQTDGSLMTGVVFVFNDRGQTAIGNANVLQRFTPPDDP